MAPTCCDACHSEIVGNAQGSLTSLSHLLAFGPPHVNSLHLYLARKAALTTCLQEDYSAWKGARPASPAKFPATEMPARKFDGATDYNANFTNKHCGVPEIVHAREVATGSIPLRACTVYAKEYTAKPIPPSCGACMDRPWMNCDSCKPSVPATPGAAAGHALMGEKTWTAPPFAIGRAAFDGRTMHKVTYKDWS